MTKSKEDVQFQDQQHVIVKGNFYIWEEGAEVTLNDSSFLEINGKADIKNHITIDGNSKMIIRGDAEFKDQVDLNSGAELTIFGNAIFASENIEFQGVLCIKGSVTPNEYSEYLASASKCEDNFLK